MPITTTLNKIRNCHPCADGWETLLRHLGKTEADDEPLPFSVIVESNGLDDALWCTRAAPEYSKEWRLYAVWCARRCSHLLTDPRSLKALEVAERHAHGMATDEELYAAWDAARAAANAAWDIARAAARSAANAAWAAADAAWDTARATARAAANAAWDIARAADADAAERAVQKAEFLRIVNL